VPRTALAIAALALSLACAGLRGAGKDRAGDETLERARTDREGVCAILHDPATEPWSAEGKDVTWTVGGKLLPSTVTGCARVLPAGEGGEEGAALDLTLAYPREDDHWRPEHWHVEVIRSSGLVVWAGGLDGAWTEPGICLLNVCNVEGHATVRLSEPWARDRYRIRLIHVPTRGRVEISLQLR
jgi:hypothetical protein